MTIKYYFLPGSKLGGGLGQHSTFLLREDAQACFWDYDGRTNGGKTFLQILASRFLDNGFIKFDYIDVLSSSYLNGIDQDFNSILGFSGCALRLFATGKKKGVKFFELESPTAHAMHCYEMNERARSLHPFEKSWLSRKLRDKMLAEYHIADRIWVNSDYALQTFLDHGVPASKLMRRCLDVDPRYKTKNQKTKLNDFQITYVGSVTVTKGVPILIETFQKLALPKSSLVLVGGTGSSGMKRYVKKIKKSGLKISICPGDPFPHLEKTNLLVHPSWSDGFGLAPMEALSFGIPVLVTENTGMKENIQKPHEGATFPCGDNKELARLIMQYYDAWVGN